MVGFIDGLGQVPWLILLYIFLELFVVMAIIGCWFFAIRLHPIACHIRGAGAGRSWSKRGARIIENKDGTRELKFMFGGVRMPCPDLKYIHQNATIIFFRPQRLHLAQDGANQYHPIGIDDFGTAFKTDSVNMKFFYVNTSKIGNEMFTPKQQWLLQNFGAVTGFVSILVCVVLIIIMMKQLTDFGTTIGTLMASASNNLASAISSIGHAGAVIPV